MKEFPQGYTWWNSMPNLILRVFLEREGFFKLINLFILAALGLSCCVRASHGGGFSCCGARALGARASVVVARGLSSCGSRAQ